jgi:hypothetical protein
VPIWHAEHGAIEASLPEGEADRLRAALRAIS